MSTEAARRARAVRAGARTAVAARAALADGVDDPVTRLVLTVRAEDPTASLGELAARCSMDRHAYISRLNRALVPLGAPARAQAAAAAHAALADGVDDPVTHLVLTVRAEDPKASITTLAARCSMSRPTFEYRLRRALQGRAGRSRAAGLAAG